MTTSKSISELMDAHFERCKQMQKLIYETKTSIVVNVQDRYEIEKSRIDTPEKIIRWTVHLSEKTWMTKELLHFFILTVCDAANIEPYGV